MKILVINGPNLNMLGIRDPDQYGNLSLENINKELKKIARQEKCEIEFFQSNIESNIISRIQESYKDETLGILINAAAYTHTSIGILDALTIHGKENPFPYVEIHLSNPKEREPFRHPSFLEDSAITTISGKQAESYYEGLRYLIAHLKNSS